MPYLYKLHFNTTVPLTSSPLNFPTSFPTKILQALLISPRYTFCQSHPSRFHPSNRQWRVQVMNQLAQSSPSFHFPSVWVPNNLFSLVSCPHTPSVYSLVMFCISKNTNVYVSNLAAFFFSFLYDTLPTTTCLDYTFCVIGTYSWKFILYFSSLKYSVSLS